jgi:hypothetical protein
MKLLIHAGDAGTSGLQRWLAARRSELAAQGVCHPDIFGDADHAGLVYFALTRGQLAEMPPALRPFPDTAAQDTFRKLLRARVVKEVAQGAGMRAWLLSDGSLLRALHNETMIDRIRDLLAAHFDEVAIYLHLRPQVEMLGAEAAALLADGLPVSQAVLAQRMLDADGAGYLDYDQTVSRWEKVFGADRVHVVAHAREPAIADHLTTALGLSQTMLGPLPTEVEAPGWRTLALANAVLTAGGGRAAARSVLFAGLPAAEPLRADAALVSKIAARFAASNAALVKRRVGLRADDFASRDEGAATLPLLETPCLFAEQLAALMRRHEHALTLERYARLLAESRQAIAEGRRDDAQRLLPAIDGLATGLAALATPTVDLPTNADPAPAPIAKAPRKDESGTGQNGKPANKSAGKPKPKPKPEPPQV